MVRRYEGAQPLRRRTTDKASSSKWLFIAASSLVAVVAAVAFWSNTGTPSSGTYTALPRRLKGPRVKIFSGLADSSQQRESIGMSSRFEDAVEFVALDADQQKEFLRKFISTPEIDSNLVLQRYEQLLTDRPHLAQELWKYCALYQYGGLYIDSESPVLLPVDSLLEDYPGNIAVLSQSQFPNTLHGSLLLVRESHSKIASRMIKAILGVSDQTLDSSPLFLPTLLHNLVFEDAKGTTKDILHWTLLEQHCSMDTVRKSTTNPAPTSGRRLGHSCPENSGYCCSIRDVHTHSVILMTKHPLLPYQVLPPASGLPKPYNSKENYPYEDLPFIATVQENIMPRADTPAHTPNFFDVLLSKDCLPSSYDCSTCLRNKEGATCEQSKCYAKCKCYCKALCTDAIAEKHVSKELIVTPPKYARDPSRLVPRIIHQTYYEDVTPEKYPNMSRLINSWKRSGWEYKFYTDNDAKRFLEMHFPPEVKDAYDALLPGAFKADLFRYCVLLIHGGVYADMDVMLESNLDAVVSPDVGFMVPKDEPGKPIGQQMCLWNGLIATLPGHPFLAKVIQTVVNNVRNRFTSVDTDALFCPNPELSITHAFDTLFTAGPCILGASVNWVLGRHGQTAFVAGEIGVDTAPTQADFVTGLDDSPGLRIPGRSIILHQNKWDMGAHRFTFLEKNMVVAATDMPDYDDRIGEGKENREHYSKTHAKKGIYGLEKLYINKHKANEDLRIYVNGEGNKHKKVL